MVDYKEMYHNLFMAVTNAVAILQEAQQITEDIYVRTDDDRKKLQLINDDQEKGS